MTERVECAVIGAGIIGLAVARQMAIDGREVLVLESENRPTMHTSTRNSGVIHAGIYYPRNSLKARLCVRGKELLYDYCERLSVPHRRVGKLVVAKDTGIERLHGIRELAAANGVTDIELLQRDEVIELEPAVECKAALLSPSTGIVDASVLASSLEADVESAGAQIATGSQVSEIVRRTNSIELKVGQDEPYCLQASTVVNAAGPWAPLIARRVQGIDAKVIPQAYFAKGHYFAYRGAAPFSRLVYPLPQDSWLGIHATPDLSGNVRFGPDIQWIDSVDYAFDESRKAHFVESIREYFPTVDPDKLQPDYTGIRPKTAGAGSPARN